MRRACGDGWMMSRIRPTPITSIQIEMIILTEQSPSALRALAKTGSKEREELLLDLAESRLLNLLTLCHAT